MSGNARELPSNKFVMNPSPGAIRIGGQLDFFVDSFLEEFPSYVCFVLVGREKLLESVESEDPEEVAALLVPENVPRERVLVPGCPEVSVASRLRKMR